MIELKFYVSGRNSPKEFREKESINRKRKVAIRGKIPPGQTIEGFFAGESVPVNQKLSDMLLQLHISERTGRGVPKITEVYGKETYEFRENSIVVSIPFTRVQMEENTQVESKMTSDEFKMTLVEEEMTLDNVQNKRKNSARYILEFCTTPKGVLEIAELLGFKEKKSVRRHIKPLVEQGRLAMTIPDKPNSKNQKYITIK